MSYWTGVVTSLACLPVSLALLTYAAAHFLFTKRSFTFSFLLGHTHQETQYETAPCKEILKCHGDKSEGRRAVSATPTWRKKATIDIAYDEIEAALFCGIYLTQLSVHLSLTNEIVLHSKNEGRNSATDIHTRSERRSFLKHGLERILQRALVFANGLLIRILLATFPFFVPLIAVDETVITFDAEFYAFDLPSVSSSSLPSSSADSNLSAAADRRRENEGTLEADGRSTGSLPFPLSHDIRRVWRSRKHGAPLRLSLSTLKIFRKGLTCKQLRFSALTTPSALDPPALKLESGGLNLSIGFAVRGWDFPLRGCRLKMDANFEEAATVTLFSRALIEAVFVTYNRLYLELLPPRPQSRVTSTTLQRNENICKVKESSWPEVEFNLTFEAPSSIALDGLRILASKFRLKSFWWVASDCGQKTGISWDPTAGIAGGKIHRTRIDFTCAELALSSPLEPFISDLQKQTSVSSVCTGVIKQMEFSCDYEHLSENIRHALQIKRDLRKSPQLSESASKPPGYRQLVSIDVRDESWLELCGDDLWYAWMLFQGLRKSWRTMRQICFDCEAFEATQRAAMAFARETQAHEAKRCTFPVDDDNFLWTKKVRKTAACRPEKAVAKLKEIDDTFAYFRSHSKDIFELRVHSHLRLHFAPSVRHHAFLSSFSNSPPTTGGGLDLPQFLPTDLPDAGLRAIVRGLRVHSSTLLQSSVMAINRVDFVSNLEAPEHGGLPTSKIISEGLSACFPFDGSQSQYGIVHGFVESSCLAEQVRHAIRLYNNFLTISYEIGRRRRLLFGPYKLPSIVTDVNAALAVSTMNVIDRGPKYPLRTVMREVLLERNNSHNSVLSLRCLYLTISRLIESYGVSFPAPYEPRETAENLRYMEAKNIHYVTGKIDKFEDSKARQIGEGISAENRATHSFIAQVAGDLRNVHRDQPAKPWPFAIWTDADAGADTGGGSGGSAKTPGSSTGDSASEDADGKVTIEPRASVLWAKEITLRDPQASHSLRIASDCDGGNNAFVRSRIGLLFSYLSTLNAACFEWLDPPEALKVLTKENSSRQFPCLSPLYSVHLRVDRFLALMSLPQSRTHPHTQSHTHSYTHSHTHYHTHSYSHSHTSDVRSHSVRTRRSISPSAQAGAQVNGASREAEGRRKRRASCNRLKRGSKPSPSPSPSPSRPPSPSQGPQRFPEIFPDDSPIAHLTRQVRGRLLDVSKSLLASLRSNAAPWTFGPAFSDPLPVPVRQRPVEERYGRRGRQLGGTPSIRYVYEIAAQKVRLTFYSRITASRGPRYALTLKTMPAAQSICSFDKLCIHTPVGEGRRDGRGGSLSSRRMEGPSVSALLSPRYRTWHFRSQPGSHSKAATATASTDHDSLESVVISRGEVVLDQGEESPLPVRVKLSMKRTCVQAFPLLDFVKRLLQVVREQMRDGSRQTGSELASSPMVYVEVLFVSVEEGWSVTAGDLALSSDGGAKMVYRTNQCLTFDVGQGLAVFVEGERDKGEGCVSIGQGIRCTKAAGPDASLSLVASLSNREESGSLPGPPSIAGGSLTVLGGVQVNLSFADVLKIMQTIDAVNSSLLQIMSASRSLTLHSDPRPPAQKIIGQISNHQQKHANEGGKEKGPEEGLTKKRDFLLRIAQIDGQFEENVQVSLTDAFLQAASMPRPVQMEGHIGKCSNTLLGRPQVHWEAKCSEILLELRGIDGGAAIARIRSSLNIASGPCAELQRSAREEHWRFHETNASLVMTWKVFDVYARLFPRAEIFVAELQHFFRDRQQTRRSNPEVVHISFKENVISDTAPVSRRVSVDGMAATLMWDGDHLPSSTPCQASHSRSQSQTQPNSHSQSQSQSGMHEVNEREREEGAGKGWIARKNEKEVELTILDAFDLFEKKGAGGMRNRKSANCNPAQKSLSLFVGRILWAENDDWTFEGVSVRPFLHATFHDVHQIDADDPLIRFSAKATIGSRRQINVEVGKLFGHLDASSFNIIQIFCTHLFLMLPPLCAVWQTTSLMIVRRLQSIVSARSSSSSLSPSPPPSQAPTPSHQPSGEGDDVRGIRGSVCDELLPAPPSPALIPPRNQVQVKILQGLVSLDKTFLTIRFRDLSAHTTFVAAGLEALHIVLCDALVSSTSPSLLPDRPQSAAAREDGGTHSKDTHAAPYPHPHPNTHPHTYKHSHTHSHATNVAPERLPVREEAAVTTVLSSRHNPLLSLSVQRKFYKNSIELSQSLTFEVPAQRKKFLKALARRDPRFALAAVLSAPTAPSNADNFLSNVKTHTQDASLPLARPATPALPAALAAAACTASAVLPAAAKAPAKAVTGSKGKTGPLFIMPRAFDVPQATPSKPLTGRHTSAPSAASQSTTAIASAAPTVSPPNAESAASILHSGPGQGSGSGSGSGVPADLRLCGSNGLGSLGVSPATWPFKMSNSVSLSATTESAVAPTPVSPSVKSRAIATSKRGVSGLNKIPANNRLGSNALLSSNNVADLAGESCDPRFSPAEPPAQGLWVCENLCLEARSFQLVLTQTFLTELSRFLTEPDTSVRSGVRARVSRANGKKIGTEMFGLDTGAFDTKSSPLASPLAAPHTHTHTYMRPQTASLNRSHNTLTNQPTLGNTSTSADFPQSRRARKSANSYVPPVTPASLPDSAEPSEGPSAAMAEALANEILGLPDNEGKARKSRRAFSLSGGISSGFSTGFSSGLSSRFPSFSRLMHSRSMRASNSREIDALPSPAIILNANSADNTRTATLTNAHSQDALAQLAPSERAPSERGHLERGHSERGHPSEPPSREIGERLPILSTLIPSPSPSPSPTLVPFPPSVCLDGDTVCETGKSWPAANLHGETADRRGERRLVPSPSLSFHRECEREPTSPALVPPGPGPLLVRRPFPNFLIVRRAYIAPVSLRVSYSGILRFEDEEVQLQALSLENIVATNMRNFVEKHLLKPTLQFMASQLLARRVKNIVRKKGRLSFDRSTADDVLEDALNRKTYGPIKKSM